MKVYTVSSSKESIRVVASSKTKAEELVRRDHLLNRTMDGHLKVEIDKLAKVESLITQDEDIVAATISADYSKKEIEVPACK